MGAKWLLAHFAEMVAPAARAARAAPPGRYGFQGHVLEAGDLLGIWTVELTLHHLDLLVDVPALGGPHPDALEVTASALDRLAGAPRPGWWDLTTYLRKATGRLRLDSGERDRLGAAASRYPVLG